MNEVKVCMLATLLATACEGAIVPVDETTDAATDSSTSTGTTTGDVADSTTIEPATSSSSSGSSDETGDEPLPLPTSRLVLDVATAGGHALMLRELVDGEPQPAVALTGDVPATARITTMPLGTADRFAFDVEFDDASHDLFLVDWTAGHPAVVTQLDAGVSGSDSIGRMAWVEELGAIVVQIGYSFYRIDVTDDGPSEPIDLLDDLPFGDALEENQSNFVMPNGPFLVVRAGGLNDDLWVADLADPSAPTVRITNLEGTTQTAYPDGQLASGHLVYAVNTAPGVPEEEPEEVNVSLRLDEEWSAPLAITAPIEFPGGVSARGMRPGTDEFLYIVFTADFPEQLQLRLGRVEGEALAPPIVLKDGATSRHTFSPDGTQLAYVVDADQSLEVVTFTDDGPSRPRTLDMPPLSATQLSRPLMISADNAWLYFNVSDDTLSNVKATLRVGLEQGAQSQILGGLIDSDQRIRQYAFAPDERWLAFAETSTRGLVTRIVDLSQAEPGEPLLVHEGDAPILDDLLASPDSNWLAASKSHGGETDSVVVTRRDDSTEAVLEDVGLANEAVWLPTTRSRRLR